MRSEPFVGAGERLQAGRALANLPLAARQSIISAILIIAMLAFELFNFDTTRFALHSLLGDVSFASVRWAAILALAFCAIDFAGLVHLCTPERDRGAGYATWYLMGAWLLGGTMNALMTWWAITLTLLNHSFGNEVLSREQILEVVPLFVAALVWLTRILFIGAFAISRESGDEEQPASWSGHWPQHRSTLPGGAAYPNLSRPQQSVLPGSRLTRRPPLPAMINPRIQQR